MNKTLEDIWIDITPEEYFYIVAERSKNTNFEKVSHESLIHLANDVLAAIRYLWDIEFKRDTYSNIVKRIGSWILFDAATWKITCTRKEYKFQVYTLLNTAKKMYIQKKAA